MLAQASIHPVVERNASSPGTKVDAGLRQHDDTLNQWIGPNESGCRGSAPARRRPLVLFSGEVLTRHA